MILCDLKNKSEKFGKKGEVLRELYSLLSYENKVFVPDTLIIPLSFFNIFIKEKLLSGDKEIVTQSYQQEIIKQIRKKFKNKKIVVRSSASCEDSILFTNSGQYDSFLNLTTDEEILSAINKIFYSFISSNAMEYYKINNIDLKKQGMAVLIQEVAPVKIAGVMFTANPTNGESQSIIEYCNGLGEDVVSGQKKVNTIKENDENIPKVFERLITIGKKIEKKMGTPQDIEWGIDENDNIYIFQARPIIINKRNTEKLKNVVLPKNYIAGFPVSMGFTIGKIKELTNCNNSEIILQTGKLTSKDLTSIINNKSILLKTGGYLSHFANIIREFNKPSIIIDEAQMFSSNELYVIDGYNGYIYKLQDLKTSEQKKSYWNYFVDLVYNANLSYLNLIGIKSSSFINKDKENRIKKFYFMIKDNELYIEFDNEILKIEFDSINLLNSFIEKCLGEKNEKIYRC